MLKVLKERLYRVSDKYAVELQKFYDDIELMQKNYEKKIAEVERQKVVLKEQEKENNKRLKDQTDKLLAEEKRVSDIQKKLSDTVSHYNKLCSSVSFDKVKSDLALQTAEGERDLAIKERKRQEQITKDYELKTTLLQKDFKELEKKKQEINQRENELKLKERVFNKKEQDRINREHALGEKDLWLKTQEKRIKLELAKLKLNAD